MTWIQTIPPDEAEGELAALYADIVRKRGKVGNILQAVSLHPEAMKVALLDAHLAIMYREGGLSRKERERIATFVSAQNACPYCVAHHAAPLRAAKEDEQTVEDISRGMVPAHLSEKEKGMLAFACRLNDQPDSVNKDDIARLRAAGYSDREILDAVLTVGYFNFCNRIVFGLGIEVTPQEAAGYLYESRSR